jgi:hypothetical protein
VENREERVAAGLVKLQFGVHGSLFFGCGAV